MEWVGITQALTDQYILESADTVGIQKITGDVYDFFSMEAHHQTALLCNDCDNAGIQILFICKLLEFLKFIRFNQNSHTFL